MQRLKLIAFVMAILTSFGAQADNAVQTIEQFMQQVNSFQANFEQTVLDPNGEVIDTAKGQFKLQRPDRFRWDYVEPYEQHIVADGEKIWFYDVDLEQVTVKDQQTLLADTPATLLSGQQLPKAQFEIETFPTEDDLHWITLTPIKEDSTYQRILLVFDGLTLTQMVMRDSFDQQTRLKFSQIKQNIDFADEQFVFVPPEGVDVVGED